jgi:hypothetical protein
MSDTKSTSLQPKIGESLANQFSRLGWIGFWIQLALLIIPLFLLIYVLILRSPESAESTGIEFSNYLSYGSLLVMLFTTFWFYRYTRLGKQMLDRAQSPSHADIVQTVWVGIWAGGAGIFFSMLLLSHAVGRLLFTLLANPQTGLMIAPNLGANPASSVSAVDAVGLTSLVIIQAAELVVLGLSLWLLYQTMRTAGEFEKATA